MKEDLEKIKRLPMDIAKAIPKRVEQKIIKKVAVLSPQCPHCREFADSQDFKEFAKSTDFIHVETRNPYRWCTDCKDHMILSRTLSLEYPTWVDMVTLDVRPPPRTNIEWIQEYVDVLGRVKIPKRRGKKSESEETEEKPKRKRKSESEHVAKKKERKAVKKAFEQCEKDVCIE